MANADHVAKLKEGVDAWNQWRKQNKEVSPDLSGIDLRSRAEWKDSPLWNPVKYYRHVDVSRIDFTNTDLRKANLRWVTIEWANLHRARLDNADLGYANLTNTEMRRANITGTNLRGAIFSNVWIAGVAYSRRRLRDKVLGIRGLDSVYGDAELQRDLRDQDFIDCKRQQWRRPWYNPKRVLLLWPWAFFDYGRAWARVVLLAFGFIAIFGSAYHSLVPSHLELINVPDHGSAFYPWFVASMGFATLGVSDFVKAHDTLGEFIMMANVLSGFVTLGLLISVLGTNFSRRAG